MKASWNWLTDYVDVKASVAEVAHRLTMAGLTVENVEETSDDVILDVEITSNRPDWLNHLGIARELAALYGLSVKVPEVKLPPAKGKVTDVADLEVADLRLCPLYTGRVIKGVKVGPSPAWLRAKVESVGLRSINNVVDATNYVMYECGQPLHAFDLAKVRGRKVVVRPGITGETITLIDGSKHTLKNTDLVIADADRPIALAGIMGGLDSEISDKTTDVFLESAKFDQYCVRITSKRFGISSDASYRFERGVDIEGVDAASRRCAQVILETAGGTLADGVLAKGESRQERRRIELRVPRIHDILGMKVTAGEAKAILTSLGFKVTGGAPAALTVEIPSYRGDVKEEIDLVEEVARIYGYDRIPLETGLGIAVGQRTARERVTEAVEEVLTASGLYGCVSFSLVSGDIQRRYSPWTDKPPVFIENRAGQENAFLRTSLVGSLLAVRKTNEDHKVPHADVYEVAHIYLPSRDELPEQPLVVAAVTGNDLLALKGIIEKALAAIGGRDAAFVPASRDFLVAGRSADIVFEGATIGYIGQLDDGLRLKVDLREPVCVAEVSLDVFEKMPDALKTYMPLRRFPGIERDIAVIVPESVLWADLADCVVNCGAANLEGVTFASIYRGAPIPEGHKSLAFRMVFRAGDRTLTGEEADAAAAVALAALSRTFGARLR